MERLLQDLRYGWRQLWNRPVLTLIAVASLALGIGANTVIFGLVDALLLRALPVAAPDRLVSIFTIDQKNPGFNPSAHVNWKDLRDQNGSFSGVLGYDWAGMSVATGPGDAAVVAGQMVSGNYFDVLGVHPALGHTFSPEDDLEGAGRSFKLVPLAQAAINPDARQGIVRASAVLLTVVGLVLLIACANVANLLLARASARRKEIAVRLSLGAGRGRLVRQLLTESLLLALLGGACGLLLAAWTDRALVSVLPNLRLPIATLEPGIDLRVLAFTLALSLLTGLLFGLAPALQTSRPELVAAIKSQSAPPGAAGRRLAGRNLLVAAQVALSLVALIAAGLFLRSLGAAQRTDPGFDADRLLNLRFNLALAGYDQAPGLAFVPDLTARPGRVPGVAAATAAQAGPFQGSIARSVFFEGQERNDNDGTLLQVNAVDPRYFDTVGVPVVRGRAFTAADRKGAPPVAIVNQFMADKFLPGKDPLGQRFHFFGDDFSTAIVGVAKTIKYNTIGEDPQPYVYLPLEQRYAGNLTLVVRAATDPAVLLPTVEREVRTLDKQLPWGGIATLRQVLHDDLWAPRMGAFLLGLFGGLALLLSTVGIYGVMSFSVAQRAREIGVRMALGARSREVVTLILYQGMTIVGIGL